MATLSLFPRAALPRFRTGRIGIVDIGSNSIRLVVYDSHTRTPAILFNEKVMAGLGRDLAPGGELDEEAMARALAALARFRALAREMAVGELRTVATAAVRDAANGPAFLARIRALGLQPELLSGDEEAAMSGQGVLAGIPDADGIVGDLGGGSLELIRVGGGEVHERVSLPLGVLRIGAIRARKGALDRAVAKALGPWKGVGQGLPFYLVGGSWRALAHLDMALIGFPLPILHHYRMLPEAPARLLRTASRGDKRRLRAIPGISSARVATLADAAALLAVLVRRLGASELIVSAYGLREGLLHASLPPAVRARDPLIEAVRAEGDRQARFPGHGDSLFDWMAPLFADEPAADARLRHAACLLADTGWRAHPDFRAERGLEVALHGNWVGVDARGRAMIGRALWTSFGGPGRTPLIDRLASPDDRAQADRWGLAMRLGQRLAGGVADALGETRLVMENDMLVLDLGASALGGEPIERRLKTLAGALGLKAAAR